MKILIGGLVASLLLAGCLDKKPEFKDKGAKALRERPKTEAELAAEAAAAKAAEEAAAKAKAEAEAEAAKVAAAAGTQAGGSNSNLDPVLVEKGKQIYQANCIQCHNKDPSKKGSIGPEQIDAPLEVVHAKVVTGRYPDPLPAGFTPKRTTKAMKKFPNLEKDVPALHAYIQSFKK